jgi:SWI/SNF-related matrix-associated actin-dependent regulator 1 of chromatin subfamily A
VVFAELTWTPSIMNQAEDRAHRIGQKNSVNIYYLHGRQTLDDLIFDLLNYKSLVTTDITDGRKVSLGMCKTDMQKIELEEVAKDGTIIDPKV